MERIMMLLIGCLVGYGVAIYIHSCSFNENHNLDYLIDRKIDHLANDAVNIAH